MTIEVETTVAELGKPKPKKTTRVAEYRYIETRENKGLTFLAKPELIILHPDTKRIGGNPAFPTKFARVVSPDDVMVFDLNSNGRLLEGIPKVFHREEINEANIENDDKTQKLVWRETRPEDYPKPLKGRVRQSGRLNFNSSNT